MKRRAGPFQAPGSVWPGLWAAGLLALLALALLPAALEPGEPLIVIGSDGVVRVRIEARVPGGVSGLPAPVQPIVATIEARVGGELAPAVYSNGTIYVVSPEGGDAVVTYVAGVSVEEGVASFNVTADYPVRLRAEPGVILLGLPGDVVSVSPADGSIEISFRGPALVRYTISLVANATTPAVGAPEEAVEPEEPRAERGLPLLQALGVAVAGFLAAGAAYLLWRRRRPPADTSALSRVDWDILEALQRSGGSMLQSEVQEALGLPKTTVWRHARKLESLGYLRIKREGKTNRLILERRVERRSR